MYPPPGSRMASPAHSFQQYPHPPSQNAFAQTPFSQNQINARYQPPRSPNQSQQGYPSSPSSASWSSEYSNQSRQPHPPRQPHPQQRLSQSGLGTYRSQTPVASLAEASRGASIPILVNGGARPLPSRHIPPVVPFRAPNDNSAVVVGLVEGMRNDVQRDGANRGPVRQAVKEPKDHERGHGYRNDDSLEQCHPVFMGTRKPVKLPNGVLSGGGMSPVATGYQFEEPLRRVSGGGKL